MELGNRPRERTEVGISDEFFFPGVGGGSSFDF